MLPSRVGWKLRAMAWTAVIPTALLPLVAGPAEAEQRKAYNKAHEVHFRSELKAGQTDKLTPAQWKKVDAARMKEAANRAESRPLTSREMLAKGRGPYRSKYFAGTLPWHRSIRDVNLANGNLFKSFTDIQVAPARGAGLAMQRTYNSQDDRIGPFGQGWTHAYDIRTEEENPDTNQTDDSLNYMDRSDFFGARHKYHRDADGLYTPPPYLFDETDSNYDKFLENGPIKDLDDTERGMDGTVKHFTTFNNSSVRERVCDSITDRYGNQTVLTYAPMTMNGQIHNLLQTVTDPSGRQIVYTWSNVGTELSPAYRITLAQGPAYSVLYSYNGDCNLQSVTLDPGDTALGHVNRSTTFGYTSVTGPIDPVTGQPTGIETGLLSSVSDSLNHTVSYLYKVGDTVDGTFVPTYTNTAWVYQVNEPGGVDSNNNTRTNVWTITSSANFNAGQGSAFNFGARITENPSQPDSAPSLVVSEDSQLRTSGTFTNFMTLTGGFYTQYDSANNVTHQQHVGACKDLNLSLLQEVSYSDMTYGPHGNMLTQTPDGVTSQTVTTTYYDASQYFQQATQTDALGHTTTCIVGTNQGVDPTGAQATSNGNKGSVLYVRDAGYNVSTNPSYQKQFAYSYNGFGQKVQEVSLNNTVTQYTYGDQWGNLTQVVQDPHVMTGDSHLARTTSMVYDGSGRVLQSTDPMQQTSHFSHNSLGQPVTVDFPAKAGIALSETVTYGYGANGRTETVTDNRGITSLAYENGCDRVHSVTDPVTGAISYTYGITGERQTLSLPGGGTWTYQYTSTATSNQFSNPYFGDTLAKDDPDSVSRKLANITDDQGRRVEYILYSDGRPYQARTNEVFDQNNQALLSYQLSQYTYDRVSGTAYSHGWLSTLNNSWYAKDVQNNWQPPKLLVQNAYDYDNSGQRLQNHITSLNENGNPVTRTEVYIHDEQNRLKTVDYGDGQTQGYSFDPMGNRLSKTDTGGGINVTEGYSYNAANMLTARAGNSYTNDADGNTLTGGGRTMTWDSQNRMVSCVNGGNTCSFVYGTDGLRRQSIVNGTGTDFVLDADMFVRERNHSTGAGIATYFIGGRGPEYRRDDASESVRWYLFDGLGSVLGEVDPNGTITSSRKYDVFGAIRGGNNPTGTSKHNFVGQLGHASEDETSLIYMRARYYDPTVGRFMSEDPGKQGGNWFTYCENSPTDRFDADGKFNDACELLFGLGAMFTAAAIAAILFKQYTTAAELANIAVWMFSMSLLGNSKSPNEFVSNALVGGMAGGAVSSLVKYLLPALKEAAVLQFTLAGLAVLACVAYSFMVAGAIEAVNPPPIQVLPY